MLTGLGSRPLPPISRCTVDSNAAAIACICLYDIASRLVVAMENREFKETRLQDSQLRKPNRAVQKVKSSYPGYLMNELCWEVLKKAYSEVLESHHTVSLRVRYLEPLIGKTVQVCLKFKVKFLLKLLSCMAYLFWSRQCIPAEMNERKKPDTGKILDGFYTDADKKECPDGSKADDLLGNCLLSPSVTVMDFATDTFFNLSGYKEVAKLGNCTSLSGLYDPTWWSLFGKNPDGRFFKIPSTDTFSVSKRQELLCSSGQTTEDDGKRDGFLQREKLGGASEDFVCKLQDSGVHLRCLWLEDAVDEKLNFLDGTLQDAIKVDPSVKSPDCGMCFGVISKGKFMDQRRYGILKCCDHAFCYACIRNVYIAETSNMGMVRGPLACPKCGVVSEYVAASSRWIGDSFEKGTFFEEFHAATELIYKATQNQKPE